MRLSNHHLAAVTMTIKQLLEAATANSDTCRLAIVVNNDGQSLGTFAEDISTNLFLLHNDLLNITETFFNCFVNDDV